MSKKLSAGDYVDGYCTKCKLDLGHKIIVMDEEKILRAKCNTCGSEHNYKDRTKNKAATRKSGSAVKKTVPARSPEKLWEIAMNKSTGDVVSYSMVASFKSGDKVSHEIFGIGVVRKTSGKRVSIIFQDKERTMVSSN